MSNVCVFEVEIVKLGTNEIVKKLHFLGWNLFQVTHICTEYIYDDSSEFKDILVEVGTIRKLHEIRNIANPYFAIEMDSEDDEHEEYDGKSILDIAKEMQDDDVMEFKCSCHEKLRAPQGMWPFLVCPNCENKIFRREVKDIGGIFIYEKMNNNKK